MAPARTATSTKKKPTRRDVLLTIRARASERDLIDMAAETVGKNRSDFMIESARKEAESVLLDRREFVVDEKTWRAFLAVLDRPAKPSAELRKTLSAKAPWE